MSDTGDGIALRTARPEDVPSLCEIEQLPQYRNYIGHWSPEQHLRNLSNPDMLYTVAAGTDDEPLGLVYLSGLTSPHHSLEIARLAVRTPGQGTGRHLLAHAARLAFHEYGAHRLWLDAWDGNDHALHIYQRFGFRVDGVFRESNLVDGTFHSMLLLSVLDREYRTLDPADPGEQA